MPRGNSESTSISAAMFGVARKRGLRQDSLSMKDMVNSSGIDTRSPSEGLPARVGLFRERPGESAKPMSLQDDGRRSLPARLTPRPNRQVASVMGPELLLIPHRARPGRGAGMAGLRRC